VIRSVGSGHCGAMGKPELDISGGGTARSNAPSGFVRRGDARPCSADDFAPSATGEFAPLATGEFPTSRTAESTSTPSAAHDELHRRVHALVNEHMDFVWRSLRRLGVSDADCDDGCQRVWVVVAQKLPHIEADRVRSYIFSVIVRVASDMRRDYKRHQCVELEERDVESQGVDAEGLVERQRVRQLLDRILLGLSWELRTVFVMYEIEGLSSPEIAQALGISRGTVASRLRLSRDAFQRHLQRHQARAGGGQVTSNEHKTTGPSSGGAS
jgi:RNA polymerase sigma-70 factor, ECF subfamily